MPRCNPPTAASFPIRSRLCLSQPVGSTARPLGRSRGQAGQSRSGGRRPRLWTVSQWAAAGDNGGRVFISGTNGVKW
ncbi:hypothetical protein E2C01_039019 [Portunus trituberculatus]|uniref:Uncharacterized protein n=1 Tax=Portunus trituberculatus TaxID=210409 RepID=A0A5B7FJK9_PORTR|nr:hypothetical protein [Portunus trituberculatus]